MAITTYGGDSHITPLGAMSTKRGAQELVCPNGIFQWKLSEYSKAKLKYVYKTQSKILRLFNHLLVFI